MAVDKLTAGMALLLTPRHRGVAALGLLLPPASMRGRPERVSLRGQCSSPAHHEAGEEAHGSPFLGRRNGHSAKPQKSHIPNQEGT